jgi:hypothetical protein
VEGGVESTEQLLRTFEARARDPRTPLLAGAVDACLDAAKAAMICSDACAPIADAFDLDACVHRSRAASDLCWAVAIALLHADAEQNVLEPLVSACAAACRASEAACAPHAPHHEFCRLCAHACQRASAACTMLLESWRPRLEE